ncbi:hypothetical protein PMAYCL1PPCAC_20144, partial [Pristionchus mayeri]
ASRVAARPRPRTTGGGAVGAAPPRPPDALLLLGESREEREPADPRSDSGGCASEAAAKPRPRRSRPRSSIHGRSSCNVSSFSSSSSLASRRRRISRSVTCEEMARESWSKQGCACPSAELGEAGDSSRLSVLSAAQSSALATSSSSSASRLCSVVVVDVIC